MQSNSQNAFKTQMSLKSQQDHKAQIEATQKSKTASLKKDRLALTLLAKRHWVRISSTWTKWRSKRGLIIGTDLFRILTRHPSLGKRVLTTRRRKRYRSTIQESCWRIIPPLRLRIQIKQKWMNKILLRLIEGLILVVIKRRLEHLMSAGITSNNTVGRVRLIILFIMDHHHKCKISETSSA